MGMRLRAQSWTAANEESETGSRSPGYEREADFQRQSLLNEQQAYLDEDMPNTGLRAIFVNQGKTLFLLLASWVLFILYIRYVSEKGNMSAWQSS